jgi:hypothetical protein
MSSYVYVIEIPDPESGVPMHYGFWTPGEAIAFAKAHDIDEVPVIDVEMPHDNN